MSETTAGAPALVTELDEERRRYERWLEQLEERRGETPEHVYARVRDDYRQRLQGVVDRLGEHAESLRTAVADLEQRTEALRAEEQQVRDGRAEAELRAMVGEYAPDQWETIQRDSDHALADLGERRAGAEDELERLRQLHALATGGSAVESEAPAAAAGAETEPVAPAMSDGPAPAPAHWEDAPADDLPFDGPGRATPAASQPPAASRVDDALHGWSRDLDEAAAPAPAAHRAEPATDSAGTAIKTLRCQECGTMNYPTEWYCERCGGELATM